jgi:uncharacterized membrane-anchored protein
MRWSGLALVLGFVPAAWAESPPKPPEPGGGPPPAEIDEAQAFEMAMAEMRATRGPAVAGKLGSNATVDVPDGFYLIPQESMGRLNEMVQNLSSGNEAGALLSFDGNSAIYFDFESIGYVEEEEKDDLDADEMLEALRKGQEEANTQRKARGMAPMHLTGWQQAPFYNEATHSLEWGVVIGRDQPGAETVNYNTRRLGRHGVMSVVLAGEKETIQPDIARMNRVLEKFKFSDGEDYASFQEGDKLAEIGLTALVVGGGLALAAKTGLLGKIWKFLVLGVAAVGAGIAKLLGRKKKPPEGGGEDTAAPS